MKHIVVCAIAVLALVACSSASATPSDVVIQTAIAQTLVAKSVPLETSLALAITPTAISTPTATRTPGPTRVWPTETPKIIITYTPLPTSTHAATLDLALGSVRIYENLGEITSADVRVILSKVTCMDKPSANLMGLDWPDFEDALADSKFVCAFFVTIENNSSKPVAYNYTDVYFVIGDVQALLADCMRCYSGLRSFVAVQPGVTQDVMFLMPFPKLPSDYPVRIMIVLGKLFDPDDYDTVTGKIAIEKIIQGR